MGSAFEELGELGLDASEEPAPEEDPGIATRKDPAVVGEAIRIRFDDFQSGETELVISLTDVISGDKAWEIVRAANMFNDEPGTHEEYHRTVRGGRASAGPISSWKRTTTP